MQPQAIDRSGISCEIMGGGERGHALVNKYPIISVNTQLSSCLLHSVLKLSDPGQFSNFSLLSPASQVKIHSFRNCDSIRRNGVYNKKAFLGVFARYKEIRRLSRHYLGCIIIYLSLLTHFQSHFDIPGR